VRAVRIFALAALVASAALGAEDTGFLLGPGADLGALKPVVAALAAQGGVRASFTERRFFPFRREATVLKGVLRISPQRGMSLQYTEPEARVMVADDDGLILRDGAGHERKMPPGSREAGAVASLLPIMRFDLPALLPAFDIRARGNSAGWTFEFAPRGPGATQGLGSILVGGSGTTVTRLEFKRSASQRVEIDVGTTETGVTFGADELRRSFR
jgi:hypothetical protein